MKRITADSHIEKLILKKELLESLLEAVQNLKSSIDNDEIAAFESETLKSEEIMAAVDALSADEAKMQCEPYEEQERVRLNSEMQTMVKHIADLNEECRAAIRDKLHSLKSSIKSTRKTKQGIGGYTKQGIPGAFYIDAKR